MLGPARTRYPIAGKTVVVSGAARGIGAALAGRLHEKGANVALLGLEGKRLAAQAQRLGPERTFWQEVDVTDQEGLEAAVGAVCERFGGIDIAIANAGIAYVGSLCGMPAQQVERTVAVNLLGVWRTDRAVAPAVRERRGYILNIASLAALLHAPLMGPYAMAKAGVDALSDSLRGELAPAAVAVGCAYFGFIDTDIVRASFAHPAAQIANRTVPSFLRKPAPLETVLRAVERGIERRARRIYAPSWVGAAYLLRGLLQPLIGLASHRSLVELGRAVAVADQEASRPEDPLLGISARATDQDTQARH